MDMVTDFDGSDNDGNDDYNDSDRSSSTSSDYDEEKGSQCESDE